jgi:hypothetical protein
MELGSIISIVLNALLGGGMLFQFFTVKALKNKANAEAEGAIATAESTELDNVEKAIAIWREMAQQLKAELAESGSKYTEVAKQVEELRKEVCKLTATSNKILKLLDRITHENLDKMVEQIKNEINGKVA